MKAKLGEFGSHCSRLDINKKKHVEALKQFVW
jgi:hypothetical protein